MKKLLLSLGALSAVVAPVAAVVACGSKTETPAKTNADHTTKVNMPSTKTLTELKAVTVGTATNAADWSTKLGVSVSSAGTTTFTWDADALTLTENQKVSGQTRITILTITPKVQTPAEALNELNENITKALAADIDAAQAKIDDGTSTVTPFTNTDGSITLNSPAEWKQVISVKTSGWIIKQDASHPNQFIYSETKKDGYEEVKTPIITWGSLASNGGRILTAWHFDEAGIELMFKDVLHGGQSLSLANLGPDGRDTGYQNLYKLISTFDVSTL